MFQQCTPSVLKVRGCTEHVYVDNFVIAKNNLLRKQYDFPNIKSLHDKCIVSEHEKGLFSQIGKQKPNPLTFDSSQIDH